MRSALLCVFFTLIVQRGSRAGDDDFKPMPIPLGEWHYERREGRAVTPHDTVKTEAPYTPVVPDHYWEDALRHSVYLTLVRDKIDQLIAKGEIISPDSKPDQPTAKDGDDHDLWEKIKTAPFDRIEAKEPAAYGDFTIMAKGRLVEEKVGFRFSEDEPTKEKCSDDKCAEGVKAFWSVKRVRQRDADGTPGRYHYELTFSVISQAPKKQRKPFENPVRTFTVRESGPERVIDMPQENRSYERVQNIPTLTHRPERAIWFHKNIVPTQRYTGRQYQHGLDRIFSTLFSDDDEVYEPPQRYRPSVHVPPVYSQFSKVGHVGSPTDQQKRLTPYPYKPHSYKYSRPSHTLPSFPHLQHHFVETESFGGYGSQSDHRYVVPQSTKLIKTTRPAVLPTPLLPPKNWTMDGDKKPNTTEPVTKTPEVQTVYKNYHKQKPHSIKINYLSDHVRPPVYNAPPGVFVTMDKKPFKPMPPLKLIHSSKPLKYNKPIDFRPSPQVLDMQQFSEPDPLFDTAFRPITWNYTDTNTTEKIEVAESTTQVNNTRKQTTKGKKPPKKHENIKSQRITTAIPEVITVSSDSAEESDVLEWANVVGAFTKTTPMVSQKEKIEISESTISATTTAVPSTTVRKRSTTTTEAIEETTVTTAKPKKRTRPPPKFSKPEKVKKHKRITTTTTKAPEVKPQQDLTPQASSAAATKPVWNTTHKPLSTTPSTTSTTTPKPTTTIKYTTSSHATTTEPRVTELTKKMKGKNRYRQSTLMYKGTSVKHDKWSSSTPVSAEKIIMHLPLTGKIPPRRKGSNFQGYALSTTQRSSDEENHEDYSIYVSSTLEVKPLSSTPSYEETADQYENVDSTDYSNNHEEESDVSDEQESKDHTEYIFEPSSTTLNEKTNEIMENEGQITTEQIITSPYSVPKNKTKCKKKKQQNTTTSEELLREMNDQTTTTETPATPSIFEELFGGFTLDESKEEKEHKSTPKPELQEQESENHAQFVKLDDDLQEFLDSLEKHENRSDDDGVVYEDEDEEPSIDEDDSHFADEDEGVSARDSSSDSYDDYQDRPYSLLELMAME